MKPLIELSENIGIVLKKTNFRPHLGIVENLFSKKFKPRKVGESS